MLAQQYRNRHTKNGYIELDESEDALKDYILDHDDDLDLVTTQLLESDEVEKLCKSIAQFDDREIELSLIALKNFSMDKIAEAIVEKLK